MRIAMLAAVTATLVLATANTALADNDSPCLCSVHYVVRPCGGSLTKAAGKSARDRFNCSKASTKLTDVKDQTRAKSEEQCRKLCKAHGRATMEKIQGGSVCKARPGQHILAKWFAYFGGKKPLDGVERKRQCPAKK